MTTQLTTNQKQFVQKMLESSEQEQEGFRLLVAKGLAPLFFDELVRVGLLAADKCSGPIPSEEPGFVHIPYWHALDFLSECARYSGELNEHALAAKVLQIVKEVSSVRASDGSPRWNYYTNRKFSEIFGLVPSSLVTDDLLNLIPDWLADRYDRGLICEALDKGPIQKFLSSNDPLDWDKALKILRHCTVLIPESIEQDDPKTVVDSYWLKELIANHSAMAGELLREPAVELFYERLNQAFGGEKRKGLSYLFRPAIESHSQNRDWYYTENAFVEGLRDALIAWLKVDAKGAAAFVSKLLSAKLEVAPRIAIHVIDETWPCLLADFSYSVRPDLFKPSNFHEIYRLLRNHFRQMNEDLKSRVVKAIESLGTEQAEDGSKKLSSLQSRYLVALSDAKSPLVEEIIGHFAKTPFGNEVFPDFLAYMESSWGNGTSPYFPDALVAYAEQGTLIEKLNSFEEFDHWHGPTISALVDALQAAVENSPESFLSQLPIFIEAKSPYQYGILAGVKKAWSKVPAASSHQWDLYWENIINFISTLIQPDSFWREEVKTDQSSTPTKNWIPPIISDLLRSGTTKDDHAYPAPLLPSAFKVLVHLLDKLPPEELRNDDAMTFAINSSRGKVIEALFNHALRACRVNDQGGATTHEEVWAQFEPVFDEELSKTKKINYEFLVLAASYISNIQYLSEQWLTKNFERLFPVGRTDNLDVALEGLIYGPPTVLSYQLLRDRGIIKLALQKSSNKKRFMDRLVERLGWAYLISIEQLDSENYEGLFIDQNLEVLSVISKYFWSVSSEQLTPEQIEKVIFFWRHCLDSANLNHQNAPKLMSSLSLLACYLKELGEREMSLMKAVAPYVSVEHHADRFIEQLERLSKKQPAQVHQVLIILLEGYTPIFDFENRLKSIILSLAENEMLEDAILLADRLRKLSGMRDLFDELTCRR